jgi:hypothetical protein
VTTSVLLGLSPAGGGAGLLPTLLESGDETLFDSGADVTVDAADAGESVAEAFGLGCFGDVVFDQPGFVRLPRQSTNGRKLKEYFRCMNITTPSLTVTSYAR